MEFTIECPVDGSVDVGVEDIETVVLRGGGMADLTFRCPICGSALTVSAVIPAFLLSALEAVADDIDFVAAGGVEVRVVEDSGKVSTAVPEDPRWDSYCEYFRRQLAGIHDAQEALDEIDSNLTPH